MAKHTPMKNIMITSQLLRNTNYMQNVNTIAEPIFSFWHTLDMARDAISNTGQAKLTKNITIILQLGASTTGKISMQYINQIQRYW